MGFVLKLCGWYPSRVDPLSGDFVQRQAIAISRQVKTVVLFAQKDPALKRRHIELLRSQKEDLFEYIYYYPSRRFFDKLWSQWYYLKILKSFLPVLKQEHGDPKIVHVNIVWRAAIWALFLHKKYKWPFVVTENSTEYQENAKENIREKGFFRKRITRQAFEKCRLFIPVSHQLGFQIQKLYGEIPFAVVPNTVDTRLFNLGKAKSVNPVFRVLHVSTMTYQKNPERMIRVLDKLAAEWLAFELILAGPAPDEVKELVKNCSHLVNRVTFTGAISYNEVARQMKAADCLLLFSRYENLPCVILEAFCSGLPVVSTRVGGIGEIVNQTNGILVPEGDEDALSIALRNLITGSTRFNSIEIAAKASALYSYETVGKSFVEIYRNSFPGNW